MNLQDVKELIVNTWGIHVQGYEERYPCYIVYDEANETFRDLTKGKTKVNPYTIKEVTPGKFQIVTNQEQKDICAISETHILLKDETEFYILVRTQPLSF